MKYRMLMLTLSLLSSFALVIGSFLSLGEAEETVDEFVALIEQAAIEEGIDPADVVLVSPPENLADADDAMAALGEWINMWLESEGANYRLHEIETFGTGENQETMGRRILFSDQGEHLPSRFVPHDPRRHHRYINGLLILGWSGFLQEDEDDITSFIDDYVDGDTASGLSPAQTTAAITRAMSTWNDLPSTTLPINQNGFFGPTSTPHTIDMGMVQFLRGYGGNPWAVAADIEHCGFLPGGFFFHRNILGATFIFTFNDGAGGKTDLDNNGLADTAFCEIYYNNQFNWKIDTDAFPFTLEYDVETTALHEAGHALGLPHFGHGFQTVKNLRVHYAPRALMNSSYTGLLQEPTGRDIGLFESYWAGWPLE